MAEKFPLPEGVGTSVLGACGWAPDLSKPEIVPCLFATSVKLAEGWKQWKE